MILDSCTRGFLPPVARLGRGCEARGSERAGALGVGAVPILSKRCSLNVEDGSGDAVYACSPCDGRKHELGVRVGELGVQMVDGASCLEDAGREHAGNLCFSLLKVELVVGAGISQQLRPQLSLVGLQALIVEVAEDCAALLVCQERVETSTILLMQVGVLDNFVRSVGRAINLCDNAAGEDEVVIELMQANGDKVVPVLRRGAVGAIVPRGLVVHGDEDVILAVAVLLVVHVLSANALGGGNGHDGFEQIRHLDKVGAAAACEDVLVAEIGEDDADADDDRGDP